MTHVVVCGTKTFAQAALVNKTVENMPRDWHILLTDSRGPEAWCRTRAEALNMAVMVFEIGWQEHMACKCDPDAKYCRNAPLRAARAMMLYEPSLVIFFDDNTFTPPIVRLAQGSGIEVLTIRGAGVSAEIAAAERDERVARYAMREYRQEESSERERLHEQGMHIIEADGLNPAVEVEAEPFIEDTERQGWMDSLEPGFQRRGLPDRFNDPEQLINFEDYTMDELGAIDQVHDTNPWWEKVIDGVIRDERRITERMFLAISNAAARQSTTARGSRFEWA